MRKFAIILLIAITSAQKSAVADAGSATQEIFTLPPFTFGIASIDVVAINDAYQMTVDTPLSIAAVDGVLANDTTTRPGPLTAVLVSDTTHGDLTLNADGSFNYAPDSAFVGQDSFTYQAFRGRAASNVAMVTLTVGATGPPQAMNDAYQTLMDALLAVNAASGVLANDITPGSGPWSAVLVSDATHGGLVLNADGSFTYAPDPAYVGQDAFTYQASNGSVTSNVATVTLTVGAAGPPQAINDAYQTMMDTLLVVNTASGVLSNDTSEAGPLTASLVSDAIHGNLTLNVDGSFTYAPDPTYAGQDTFTYQASDGSATSNIATVTLTVTGEENSAPQIVTGEVAFSKRIIDGDVNETHAAEASDLDGDGDVDFVATAYVTDKVYLYINDGNGGFAREELDANLNGAYPVHVGDVDQDGHIDVLAGGYLGDVFAWYKNDGQANFMRFTIDTTSNGPHSIVTVDLDEDGDIDLVTSSQDAGTIAWYENDGAENFTRHIIDTGAYLAKRAEVADFDGDGDVDVVSASYRPDEIAWYQNDGNQNFTKRSISKLADGGYYVSPADADGDGDIDVFSASQLDNTIEWHKNDGAGNFTTHLIDNDAERARTVIAADMDGDGDVDAVAASVDDDTVAWHENDGTGNFTKHVIDNVADGAYGVAGVDMDRDGDLDVLAALKDADDVVIYTAFRAHSASVAVGGTLTINATLLLTTDADDGPGDLTYTITDTPDFGQLRLNSVPLAAGGVFSQDDVNNGRLTYVHGGAAGTTDSFSFTVADGGEDGIQPATGVFSINAANN